MEINIKVGLSSLAGAGVVAAIFIISGFLSNPGFYCEAEQSLISCPGGLSGGYHTRCYLNEEKSSWDYCKSGWIEVIDDREPVDEDEPPIIKVKGPISIIEYNCNLNDCPLK